MNQPIALIVDDELDIRELLEITLARMNIDTEPGPGTQGSGGSEISFVPRRHAPSRRRWHRAGQGDP